MVSLVEQFKLPGWEYGKMMQNTLWWGLRVAVSGPNDSMEIDVSCMGLGCRGDANDSHLSVVGTRRAMLSQSWLAWTGSSRQRNKGQG